MITMDRKSESQDCGSLSSIPGCVNDSSSDGSSSGGLISEPYNVSRDTPRSNFGYAIKNEALYRTGNDAKSYM